MLSNNAEQAQVTPPVDDLDWCSPLHLFLYAFAFVGALAASAIWPWGFAQ